MRIMITPRRTSTASSRVRFFGSFAICGILCCVRLPLVGLLVGSQNGVHPALVPRAFFSEPLQDVGIDAQGDLSFPRDGLPALADDRASEFFGRDLRKIGEIDVLVLHPVDPIPITLRLRRSSFVLHGVSPFSPR